MCCDCCEVGPITSCVKKMKDVTRCVFECLEMRPTRHREMQIAFCILLTEISVINDKLDWLYKCLCEPPCREEAKQASVPASGREPGGEQSGDG